MSVTSRHPTLRTRTCALAITAVAALALAPAAFGAADAVAAGSGGVGGPGSEASGSEAGDGKAKPRAKRYARMWRKTSRADRRWAHRTAICESGRNPKAIGGGGVYRGAFQFMRATWNTSPKTPGGDPIRYSYRTQAVVAIALKKRDGAGHWPVCG